MYHRCHDCWQIILRPSQNSKRRSFLQDLFYLHPFIFPTFFSRARTTTHRHSPENVRMSRTRNRFVVKPSTILSIITTLLLLIYYLQGLNLLPDTILLPAAGQVLSVGIHSLSTIIFALLTRCATRRALPLDVITPFLINIDTHLGGSLTLENIVLAPFVNLLMLHTPETLLGTLASGKPDIRSVGTTQEKVEMGPFGGAFNNDTYYLSGQLLLSSTNPDSAYRQVAYRSSVGWVIPRKPVPWYEVFRRTLQRDNDAEKRITVPDNEAAVLVPVASVPQGCTQRKKSDFGFELVMHHCDSYIGFAISGSRTTLPSTQKFYRLYRGRVLAKYASWKGERFVEGGVPSSMVAVPFPRAEKLWIDMSHCFLNAASFHRPLAKISLTDRLVISSVVRIAGFEEASGFSEPAAVTDALVTDVVNTNISRWVVVTMIVAVGIDIIRVALSKLDFELLAPELEALVLSFREVRGLSGVGRFARESRGPFHRIWGWFERDEHGGGKWAVPGGMNGHGKVAEGDDGIGHHDQSAADQRKESGAG